MKTHLADMCTPRRVLFRAPGSKRPSDVLRASRKRFRPPVVYLKNSPPQLWEDCGAEIQPRILTKLLTVPEDLDGGLKLPSSMGRRSVPWRDEIAMERSLFEEKDGFAFKTHNFHELKENEANEDAQQRVYCCWKTMRLELALICLEWVPTRGYHTWLTHLM